MLELTGTSFSMYLDNLMECSNAKENLEFLGISFLLTDQGIISM